MKFFGRLILFVAILSTGCAPAPAPVSFTPTVISTALPTLAPTFTSTVLPTPTETLTPTPVPPGGRLMMVIDNELKVIHADGSGEETLIQKEQFEAKFPAIAAKNAIAVRSALISPDGQKILVQTCTQFGYNCDNNRLYLSTIDLAQTVTITSFNGGLLEWSPTSDKFLMQSSTDPLNKSVVSAAKTSFGKISRLPASTASFWSFDGSQVYFFRDGTWSIVKTDGSGKQTLKCDLCAMAPDPISYAVAQSPDGRQIAIGYRDGMVVIASSDLASYKLAAVGSYISRLRWSPDSQKLAVDVSTDPNQSDVIILGVDGTLLKRFNRPAGVNFINTCGWSPDSSQVDYMAALDSGSDLYLQALEQETPVRLVSFKNFSNGCPIWLPGTP